jgi:hypothetical protein
VGFGYRGDGRVLAGGGLLDADKVADLVQKPDRVPLTPEKRWFTIQIVTFAAAESIVLSGFVARIVLGSPAWFSYLFYAIGILLLLIFEPADRPASIT